MRVMSGLDMLINYLDNRPTLEKLLSHMADQHAMYAGVTSGAFDVSRPYSASQSGWRERGREGAKRRERYRVRGGEWVCGGRQGERERASERARE